MDYQSLQEVTADINPLYYHSKIFVDELDSKLSPVLEGEENYISLPITEDQLRTYWIEYFKLTSSSASSLHFGQYIYSIKYPILFCRILSWLYSRWSMVSYPLDSTLTLVVCWIKTRVPYFRKVLNHKVNMDMEIVMVYIIFPITSSFTIWIPP